MSLIQSAKLRMHERIARSLLDVDHFVSQLSQELARSKAAVVRELARDLAAQVQALRLAINMERTGEHLLGPVQDLKVTAGQLRLICTKTRICSNDELFELQPVLAGRVLGQLAGVTAAPYIRSGGLVPVLIGHMPNYASYFVYFGSRSLQPARARAFNDLALQRLGETCEYVPDPNDLRGKPATKRAGKKV